MRHLILFVLALIVVPPAAAADLTIVPRDFSPKQKRLRIKASLPQLEHVGVQLARATVACSAGSSSRAPALPRLPLERAARRAEGVGRRLPDPARRRAAGARHLPAPRSTRPRRRSRTSEPEIGPAPFRGDNERYTTISPNGDKLRESAKISFTLNEPAQVHFEVTRTISPTTIYELWANLKPGRTFSPGIPHWSMGAHT